MARLPIPFNNPRTYAGHSGVDYPQPRGTVFRASGPGTVKTRSFNSRGGYYIWVQYDNGPLVGYHHMDNHNGCPAVGARVNTGDRLGYVGNTGNSTGPHLHSEVAGYATTAGYWQFFDPNNVVGGGSTAGGSPSGGGQWSDTKKQQFLTSIGLDTGGVGNGWGPKSAEATRTFQGFVQLPVDGVFGPNTTSVAQVIEAGRKLDSVSRSVADIQRKIGAEPVDGIWGPKTSLQTYRAQRANGLDADAIYGPATDSKLFAVTPPPTSAPAFPLAANEYFGPEQGGTQSISGHYSHREDLKVWQSRMIALGFDLGPDGADGLYGPKGSNSTDTYTGKAAKALQTTKGVTADGLIGPATWALTWTEVTPPVVKPDPNPPTTPDSEASATPNIVSPGASDFPAWIRYEEKFDAQFLASTQWNLNLQNYYKKPYAPIELHTHWWGLPGEAGTHDGNVDYLNRTADVGANYVVSAGRVTLTMPLNKIALTTGQRNPYAWKCECDPLITTSVSNHGYKTLGFLTYLVEKLNPSLANEAIRLHKEFYATSCSNIDVKKVREYADAFKSGALDPATGEPPVTPEPEPEPDEKKEEIYALLDEVEKLVSEL